MTMHSTSSAPRLVVNNADTSSRPALSRRGSSASIASLASSTSAPSAASERVSAWAHSAADHAVAPDSVAVTKFSTDVAALMKRTQVARNVLPMIVRGGAMASVGMLLFGHFAPIAILGTMLGALVGGYLIAKFMQLRLSKQMQSGPDAQMLDAIREAPEGASARDLKHRAELLSFIEGGDVFKTGVTQAYAQPFKGVSKRLDAAANGLQARMVGARPMAIRPGSPTLTDAEEKSESGSVYGADDEKSESVKDEPVNLEGRRYSAEEKGKGRADGKVFVRTPPRLVPSESGINEAAMWATPNSPKSGTETPLIDLNSRLPSSETLAQSASSASLATFSTVGEEKIGLLSDDDAKSLRTPVMQPSPAKVPGLTRSSSVRSMQASISELDLDSDDEIKR